MAKVKMNSNMVPLFLINTEMWTKQKRNGLAKKAKRSPSSTTAKLVILLPSRVFRCIRTGGASNLSNLA